MLILTSQSGQSEFMELLTIAFLILVGPMAVLYGADTSLDDVCCRRGWWPGHGRERAP